MTRAVLEAMAAAGWDGLTLGERSVLYARWMDDAAIGGRLTPFLSRDVARTWIKNGPVKEWPHARAGIGRWADAVPSAGPTAATIVRHALGPEWTPDVAHVRTKPLRLLAHRGDEEVVVAWGPPRDLKHLIWAALSAAVRGEPLDWLLVVTGDAARPVSAEERVLCERYAERCRLRIVTVDLR